MIKNIIFDMGNVLLDYNPDVCLDLYVDDPKDKKIIYNELFCGPEWVKKDLGLITDEQLFTMVKKRIPIHLISSLEKCVYGWQICMKPLPGAREFIDYVKNKGYGIYILSNASTAFYDYFPKFLPLNYFDGIVVSSDIHLIKPSPDIYKHLLTTYSLSAENCLFIDDRIDNVTAARDLNMYTYQFNNSFNDIKDKYKI